MIVFATPAFLWGLVASLLPWILRRRIPREIPRVSFAFISFLREVEAQEFMSPRIQEWLLLILRILMIVGLVLAAADPVWVSGEWGRTANQTRAALQAPSQDETVLLLDRSASMRRTVGDLSVWQLAVDRVEQLLRSDPDRTWAIGFWTDGENRVASLPDRLHRGNVEYLIELLHKTEPVDRPSDFQVLLSEIRRNPTLGTAVLFTDHQASGWRGLSSATGTSEETEPLLWAVLLGEPARSGVWVDIVDASSFPWAVQIDEEVQTVVRQWGTVDRESLNVQLRMQRPEPLVLAESSVRLDPSPPENAVVDHPVNLIVNLGTPPETASFIKTSLVLVEDNSPDSPIVRVSGEVPILTEAPVSLIGEGPIQKAVSECLQSEGSPAPFQMKSVPSMKDVPTDTLVAATLSSLRAQPGGITDAAAWVRSGGRCLLLLDRQIDTTVPESDLELLFDWVSPDSGVSFADVLIRESHPVGRAFSDWPDEIWEMWRSLYPGHSPSSLPVVYAVAGDGRMDIVGEAEVGLGRVVYVNLGPQSQVGSLVSSLFPVVVLESLKHLAPRPELDNPLQIGLQPEHDIRPLLQENREAVEATNRVAFVTFEEISQPGALLASPVRFRSALLGIVILLGLGELWLANRGITS